MSNGKTNLDTGDPGFNLGGNTATFDVGDPDSPGQQLDPRNDQIDVDDSFYTGGKRKDLSKGTRLQLGQYLGRLTRGKEGSAGRANEFPVDADTQIDIATETEKNYPSPVAPSSNSRQFASSLEPGLSSTSRAYATIGSFIKKGADVKKSAVNGNDLLKGVSITTADQTGELGSPNYGRVDVYNTSGIVTTRYTSALLEKNRFQPDSQRGLSGEYSYQQPETKGFSGGADLSPYVLTQVGPGLSLRSSLETGATNAGLQPSSPSQVDRSVLPSSVQFGLRQKFEASYMEASNVLTSLAQDQTTNYVSIGGGQAGEDVKSWGNLNNVNDPFDGYDSLGMSLLAIALILALSISITALGAVLSLVGAGGDGKIQHLDPVTGLYPLGKSRIQGTNNQTPSLGFLPVIDLGLYRTQNNYFECVGKGLLSFFSVPGSPAGLVAKAALALLTRADPFNDANPKGFDVVVCRMILRSAFAIAEAFSKIGGSPLNVISGITKSLKVLRSSKLFAAMNVFAKIGDDIATHYENVAFKDNSGALRTKDGVNNDAAQSPVLNNRLRDANGEKTSKLAWGASRSRAMYLLPATLSSNLIVDSKISDFGINSEGDYGLSKTLIGSSRIPKEFVDSIERELDAEYVPFYFHDLRTNEIVSFHSFLTSLTDSYAAAYDSVEGFGRVEPARIYRSTTRKFGFSFYIVATNEEDFSEMYRKINKLTTLIYPQYTQGKEIYVDKDNKFTQPFSQLIGASPLIRVRLGDIARSNYTKFALARLFGLGNNLTLNGKDFSGKDANVEKSQLVIKELDMNVDKMKNALLGIEGSVFIFSRDLELPRVESMPKEQASTLRKLLTLTLKTKGSDPSSRKFTFKVIKPTDISQEYYDIVTQGGRLVKDAEEYVKSVGDVSNVPADSLNANTRPNIDRYLKTNGLNSSLTSQEIADFFSNNSNSLVKYFESAGGKGLAGHVENLEFKWMESSTFPTWNVDVGATAPNMCQVNMSFAPVHDISPGLDHLGYNRAPIYPVGNFSRQRK